MGIYIRNILVILWICILPLVGYAGMYEGAKLVTFFTGGILLCIDWVVFRRRELSEIFTRLDSIFFIWLTIMTIAAITGLDPVGSIIGTGYRHNGIVFFILLWLILKTFERMSNQWRVILSLGLLFGVFIQIPFSLVQTFIYPWLIKPVGTLGESNGLAGYIGIALPILNVLSGKRKGIISVIAVMLLSLLIIFLKSSIGVLLSFIMVFCFVLSLWNKFRKRIRLRWLVICCIIVIPLFILGSKVVLDKLQRHPSAYEERLVIWSYAVEAIMKRPFFGYGLETTERVISQTYTIHGINLQEYSIDRAHNLPLDLMLWGGILGFVIFSIWIISILRNLWWNRQIWSFIGVVFFLFFAWVQPLGVVHWLLLIFYASDAERMNRNGIAP